MRRRMSGAEWAQSALAALAGSLAVILDVPWYGRLFLLFFAVLFAASAVGSRIYVPEHDIPNGRQPAVSLDERRQQVISDAQRLQIKGHDLMLLSLLLLHPQETRERVSESVDLREDPIVKKATVTVKLDHVRPDQDLYVPIMRPVKRRLITGLTATLEDGTPLERLNHEESLVLLARLSEEMLRKACHWKRTRALEPSQGAIQKFFVDQLLRLPANAGETTALREAGREAVFREFDALAQELQRADEQMLADLRRLVGLVAFSYVIVARVRQYPTPDRLTFTYSYNVSRRANTIRIDRGDQRSIDAESGQDAGERKKQESPFRRDERLRSVTRAIARTGAPLVRVSVNKGNSCRSYHLVVTAPEGHHIGSIRLLDEGGRVVNRVSQPDYDYGRGYFRASGKSTPRAHMYARGLSSLRDPALHDTPDSLEVGIYETPPGAMLRALIVSFLVLSAVYLVALYIGAGGQPNVDAFAVLGGVLSAAVIVLGWVNRWVEGNARVASLLAMVSSLWSVSALGAGGWLVILHYGAPQIAPLWGASFFGVQAPLWVVLCVLALINVAWTGLTLLTRVVRFDGLMLREARNLDTAAVLDVVGQQRERNGVS